jgi:hypothetical protein
VGDQVRAVARARSAVVIRRGGLTLLVAVNDVVQLVNGGSSTDPRLLRLSSTNGNDGAGRERNDFAGDTAHEKLR